MPKKIAIKLTNLSKSYKLYTQPVDRVKEALHFSGKKYHTLFHAIKGLSFEITKGETVGIIGRNGSGKSTLLKMITKVLTPSGGRLVVHGQLAAILELGAGFNPEMTGMENIYLNTSINGFSRHQTDQIRDKIVKFAELAEFIHRPIKTYSSGMKARLAFAVAINVDPDILIIDEVLSVGDVAFQRKCFAKIEEIRGRGTTVLFVSHSEGSIVSLCNRAIWLNHGEQVLDGEPKLVTGLYIKYSNAKQIDRAKLFREYQELASNKADSEGQGGKKRIIVESARDKKENLISSYEIYDPILKPKSTISYETKGARISDVKVTTLNGKKVNILIHGREYIYTYKVDFFEDQIDVRFGCLIKSCSGISLGGGSFPVLGCEGMRVKSVSGKQVRYRFKCLFNEGTFFLNAGVSSCGEYIHRVLDAYAFKVLPIEDKMFTGPVSFITDCDIYDA